MKYNYITKSKVVYATIRSHQHFTWCRQNHFGWKYFIWVDTKLSAGPLILVKLQETARFARTVYLSNKNRFVERLFFCFFGSPLCLSLKSFLCSICFCYSHIVCTDHVWSSISSIVFRAQILKCHLKSIHLSRAWAAEQLENTAKFPQSLWYSHAKASNAFFSYEAFIFDSSPRSLWLIMIK